MKEIGVRLAAFFLAALLCVALPIGVSAAEETANFTESPAQTIRIGVCASAGNDAFHQNRAVSGYLIGYLEQLAHYAEIKENRMLSFAYLTAETEREMELMLAEGKVDLVEISSSEGEHLLSKDSYTPAFLAQAHRVSRSIGETLYSLCTLREERQLCYEDAARFDGITIGAVQGSGGTLLLQRYARENKFKYTLKSYPGDAELLRALEEKTIQAAVTDSAQGELSRIIAPLGKAELSLGSNQASGRELTGQLSRLQEYLYTYEPFYDSQLADRHFSARDNLYDAFTQEEKEYAARMDPVRVAICADDELYVSYDEASATFSGTYIELLNLVSKRCEIPLQMIRGKSWDDCLMLVREGKADAAAGVYGVSALADQWNLTFTGPILSKDIAVVGEKGKILAAEGSLSVGATGGRSEEWSAYLRQYFPNCQARFYQTEEDCYRAVEEGEVGFSLIDGNSLQANRLYAKYKNVNIIPSLSQKVEIMVGVSKDAPRAMQYILNKGMNSLSESEIISCQMHNTLSQRSDFAEMLLEYLPYLLLTTALICTAFVSVLLVSAHRKKYMRQKSAFFSNMSHEIRTPLNGVIGMTAIAQKNIGNAERMGDCLQKIDRSCFHLLAIVNDILDLSKLENKKMRIAREPLDMATLLHPLHSLYYQQAREKGIDFDTIVSGLDEERVAGDFTRVMQVLMNLLSNALKFTEPGKRVRLRVEQLGKKNGTVQIRFSVVDEGIGIHKENIDRVFNAYEQQGAKNTGKNNGSGLGLPILRQLVGLMGGTLQLKSEPGRGSAFSFTLSLGLLPSDSLRDWENDRLGAATVLILDKEEEVCSYLEQILAGLGMNGESAHSGEEAASLLREHSVGGTPYQYFLADWGMPAPERRLALDALREQKAGETKLLVYASSDFSELQTELEALGVDRLIEKPVLPSGLSQAFHSTIEKSPSPAKRGGESGKNHFPGKRVLIAEDNEVNMEILSELIRMTGCEIDTAENGREAVDKFSVSPEEFYDLIFMDIQMPELDGYGATRQIRALERGDAAAVAIVAMTANAFAEDIERALDAGMNRHLSKPVDVELLYETMQLFLAGE